VLAEERPVLPPRLGRRLRERAAHREEQLGRLPDHRVHPVDGGPDHENDDRDGEDPDRRERG
jgi:hypothetical protein